MGEALWALAHSPVFWVPGLTALLVWVFMIGYKIGLLNNEWDEKRGRQ